MQVDIAIIGAGFSGTTLAIQVLRRANCAVSIALIDREDRVARGVAYGSMHKDQLLNVAAGRMSALADEPGHFITWLDKSLGLKDVEQAFLPRHLYGEYLQHTLNTARRESRNATVRQVAGLVSSLRVEGERFRVEYSPVGVKPAEPISAHFVVVAAGNYPPPDPPEMQSAHAHRYVGYPWAPDALEGIGDTDDVLILGSGLTALDQIFTLKNRGFRGRIHIISGRGLLPSPHQPSVAWPRDWATVQAASILSLMREVRREIASAAQEGVGWRAVIDSLRRSSSTIWRSFSLVEQRRFLRHVRPFWEVHRHRVSPEVHAAVRELIQESRLTVWAGRCTSVSEKGDCAEVIFRPRGRTELRSIAIQKIINCTGPNTIRRLASDPLITSILEAGMGRPDPLGMGLDTINFGEMIDVEGRSSGRLFAIGPMRKGNLWETTAVPEIRTQALDLADHLLALLVARPGTARQDLPATQPQNMQRLTMKQEMLRTNGLESQIVEPSLAEEPGR